MRNVSIEYKTFVLAVITAVLIWGCRKEEITPCDDGRLAIEFRTYSAKVLTKAATDLTSGSFSLAAYVHSPDAGPESGTLYFESQKYTWSSTSGSFTTYPAQYWPEDEALDFYAVIPDTITAGKTCTINADGNLDFQAATLEGRMKPPSGDTVHTVHTVQLEFGHKMNRVSFKVSGAYGGLKYRIDTLILTANSSSTYTWATGSTAASWSPATESRDYVVVDENAPMEFMESDAPVQRTVPESSPKYIYCIPVQPEPAGSGMTVSATVKYKVYYGTTLISDLSDGVTVDLTSTATGMSNIWGINHSVVYALTLNPGSSARPIEFAPLVENWVECIPLDKTLESQPFR